MLKGSKEVQELLRGAHERLVADLPATLQEVVNRVAIHAKQNHGYTTRTGALERSVTPEVDPSGLAARVYLSDDWTTTDGGWNYAELIHEGTRHIPADPFLHEAAAVWEEQSITDIQEAIWHSLTRP